MMSPPPWLNISPQLYLGAMEAGAQTELAQRRQDTTEQEAADRLQLNYLQLQEQAKIRQQQAAETLRAHSALEQYRQSEILNRQQAMAQQARAEDALNLYRQGEAQRDQQRIGLAEKAGLRAEDAASLAREREDRMDRHQQYLESLNTNRWSDQQKAQVRWLMQQEKNLSTPGLDEFGNSDRAKLARQTRIGERDKVKNALNSLFTNPAGAQLQGAPGQGAGTTGQLTPDYIQKSLENAAKAIQTGTSPQAVIGKLQKAGIPIPPGFPNMAPAPQAPGIVPPGAAPPGAALRQPEKYPLHIGLPGIGMLPSKDEFTEMIGKSLEPITVPAKVLTRVAGDLWNEIVRGREREEDTEDNE